MKLDSRHSFSLLFIFHPLHSSITQTAMHVSSLPFQVCHFPFNSCLQLKKHIGYMACRKRTRRRRNLKRKSVREKEEEGQETDQEEDKQKERKVQRDKVKQDKQSWKTINKKRERMIFTTALSSPSLPSRAFTHPRQRHRPAGPDLSILCRGRTHLLLSRRLRFAPVQQQRHRTLRGGWVDFQRGELWVL